MTDEQHVFDNDLPCAEEVRGWKARAEQADATLTHLREENARQAETERAMVGCVNSWMVRAEQAEMQAAQLREALEAILAIWNSKSAPNSLDRFEAAMDRAEAVLSRARLGRHVPQRDPERG